MSAVTLPTDANFTVGTSAEVVADSLSPTGVRLTTVDVTLHRYVLAELNTHRALSRNSASSRAVPIAKKVARVSDWPALPVRWGTAQPGMQSGPPLTGDDADHARRVWLQARDAAVEAAQQLADLGVHKEVTNRLLEPFEWHRVIVTATDWWGFFAQRRHRDAQPEIRAAADAIYQAIGASTPRSVPAGGWHLPLVDPTEAAELGQADACRVSAARCARTSYLTHRGVRDWHADLDLYQRLATADPPHASPLEHVATPHHGDTAGNFHGWAQLRHQVFPDW